MLIIGAPSFITWTLVNLTPLLQHQRLDIPNQENLVMEVG